ncbi:hypothetical protein CHU98_g6070 [Xylaria longipes]|nr:hypothetical protein CHU98_g6070 [Xylaria longipes]
MPVAIQALRILHDPAEECDHVGSSCMPLLRQVSGQLPALELDQDSSDTGPSFLELTDVKRNLKCEKSCRIGVKIPSSHCLMVTSHPISAMRCIYTLTLAAASSTILTIPDSNTLSAAVSPIWAGDTEEDGGGNPLSASRLNFGDVPIGVANELCGRHSPGVTSDKPHCG